MISPQIEASFTCNNFCLSVTILQTWASFSHCLSMTNLGSLFTRNNLCLSEISLQTGDPFVTSNNLYFSVTNPQNEATFFYKKQLMFIRDKSPDWGPFLFIDKSSDWGSCCTNNNLRLSTSLQTGAPQETTYVYP